MLRRDAQFAPGDGQFQIVRRLNLDAPQHRGASKLSVMDREHHVARVQSFDPNIADRPENGGPLLETPAATASPSRLNQGQRERNREGQPHFHGANLEPTGVECDYNSIGGLHAVLRFGKQGGQPCRRGLWKSSVRASMPVRASSPRCMESLHDFDAVHWDHEPFRGTPVVWSPAFRRSGPAKARLKPGLQTREGIAR